MLRFIFSRIFLKQLAILLAVATSGLVLLHFWMGYVTEHGTVIEVPNYLGMPMKDLDAFADSVPLQYVIIDSIYSDDFPKGTVADQDPAPGTGAKQGRKVYLTVNAMMPQQVKMPDLHDLSFRQAKAVLETVGLRLGDISFRPDIAKNAVLDQHVGGRSVRSGQLLFKGARVNLVLGDGLSNVEMPMPYLLYHRLDSVTQYLRSLSLNIGVVVIDTPVTDSTRLRVYRQLPAFDPQRTIRGGDSFDIFVKQDSSAISYDRAMYRMLWDRDTLGLGNEPIEIEPEEDFDEN
ncbi:MAG: PASTA domain-containing protein [Flavobacteriales bacterium]|nr:PASTA domain-containing protein [Flavobacteriales bacterium]